MSALERNYPCVMFWRSLCFVSVTLLAGCSVGNVGPAAATVPMATTAVAPAHAPPCWSNDDCSANHTGGLCMPKAATKELSDAEDFLERASSLHNLIASLADTSSSSPFTTILQQVREDLSTYSRLANGQGIPPGADAPPTPDQRQAAAWMQSGATQAFVIIRQFRGGLSTSPIATDARKVYIDVTGDGTGLHPDTVISDLQTFLHDLEVVLAPIDSLVGVRMPDGGAPGPETGAGATKRYLDPVLEAIHDAMSSIDAFLDPSAISQLRNDLTMLSRGLDVVGKDGNPGTCLESPRHESSTLGGAPIKKQ
jgi:hypothetical protein